MEDWDGEAYWKVVTSKTRVRWEDRIKMDLMKNCPENVNQITVIWGFGAGSVGLRL